MAGIKIKLTHKSMQVLHDMYGILIATGELEPLLQAHASSLYRRVHIMLADDRWWTKSLSLSETESIAFVQTWEDRAIEASVAPMVNKLIQDIDRAYKQKQLTNG